MKKIQEETGTRGIMREMNEELLKGVWLLCGICNSYQEEGHEQFFHARDKSKELRVNGSR